MNRKGTWRLKDVMTSGTKKMIVLKMSIVLEGKRERHGRNVLLSVKLRI